jgi:hypothetical protein
MYWRFKYSLMLCCVDWWTVTYVLEELSASIFRISSPLHLPKMLVNLYPSRKHNFPESLNICDTVVRTSLGKSVSPSGCNNGVGKNKNCTVLSLAFMYKWCEHENWTELAQDMVGWVNCNRGRLTTKEFIRWITINFPGLPCLYEATLCTD